MSKKGPVLAMTGARWDSLTEKQQWDIKTALRGPDSYYGETLKWFTTSVIRGHMRKVFRVGGTVNTDLGLVITPQPDYIYSPDSELPKAERWNHHHFVQHIREAAEHIGIPDFRIPEAFWHKVMRMQTPTQAISAIFEEATKADTTSDKNESLYLTSTIIYYKPHIAELKRHLESGKASW